MSDQDNTYATAPHNPSLGDFSYLHPDQLRVGGAGVFAGTWAWCSRDGQSRIPVAFAGTLIDVWNGWAVFSCARTVAEVIVRDQQDRRDTQRRQLQEQGHRGDELAALVDGAIADMVWDGDEIVVDERRACDDEEAVSRIAPDEDGQYVVNGWSWCWEAIDPADCDRIVGDLPHRGEHQQYVQFTHTGLRAPHDRLRVCDVLSTPGVDGPGFTATLQLDGQQVATLANRGTAGPTMLYPGPAADAVPGFGWAQLVEFAAACWLRGRRIDEFELLAALTAEAEQAAAVRSASPLGGIARLVDADGDTLTMVCLQPRPAPHERATVAAWLATEHRMRGGAQWELWTGSAWCYLGRVSAPDGAVAPDHHTEVANGGL
jgi:hypothetical protein